MKQRNSYLDSVNSGRRRRTNTDFEAISSTLSGLEAELDRLSRTRNTRAPASRTPLPQRLQSQPTSHPAAGEAANTALLGRITREIESLRAEMRGARPVNLEREIADLHRQLAALQGAVERAAPHDMSGEFDRLYERLDHIPGPQGHDQLSILAAEMDELKQVVASLAREDSLRAVEERWNQFDERWDTFQDTMLNKAGQPHNSEEILNLADRIYNLQELVASLPQTLPLGELEQQIGVLAKAIEHMAAKDGNDLSEAFAAMEERLDELSRAVVSSSVSNQPPMAYDFSALDRIEARVSSLAKQFEDGGDQGAQDAIAARIEALAEKIDAAMGGEADSSSLLSAFDERLQGLHRRIEDLTLTASDGGLSVAADGGALRSLETRLDEVLHRLDSTGAGAGGGDGQAAPAYMGQIEERIQELSDRLKGTAAIPQPEALDALEARLQDITARLDHAALAPQGDGIPALANLEAQISDISHYLSGMAATQAGDSAIEGRLTAIEQSIEQNRDTIFEVARAAAENALSAFQGAGDTASGTALAEELRSLEALARSSDERHTKTFGAIHETLLRIVDRISALEQSGVAAAPAAPAPHRHQVSDEATPTLDPAYDEPLPPLDEDSFGPVMRDSTRSPAEAAAAAARAAVSETPEGDTRSGMVGGLARALGRKSRKAAPEDEPVQEPSFEALPEAASLGDDDGQGDFEDDTPMEPGSGAPDLDAIMRRVRDDRGATKPRADANDSGRQDFLAAARRAAQAAAAEAAVVSKEDGRRKTKKTGQGAPDLKALATRHKKPLMMAAYAVLLAIAGWQLGKTFFADADQPTQTAAPAKQIERPVSEEPASLPASETADARPVRVIDPTDADNVDANAKAASIDAPADDGVVVDSDSGEIVDPRTVAETPAADMSDDPTEAAALPGGDASMPSSSIDMPPPEVGPIALREAAASGNAAAMFEIGSRYGDGRNGEQNLGEAFKWYKMAAEAGFAPAQYRLGSLYEKGIGVERDIPQAKTWYQMAAAQGNASAMHNLAVLFAMGADGTPDHESAVNWFTQAAELGVKDSQYNLGILAANGQGMQQNLEESYKWFALAAKAGDKEAATKRDEVFKVLRPEQQTKARATTELWKPKPLNESTNSVAVPDEWRETNERTASVDMKKAVQNIQGILNKNGYDAGVADGVMGARTKAAIKAFEADSGLPVDGEIDDALIKALLSKN